MLIDDEVIWRGVLSGVCTFCKHPKNPFTSTCDAFEKNHRFKYKRVLND